MNDDAERLVWKGTCALGEDAPHCLHEQPSDPVECVCCWCGDLFLSHHDTTDIHWKYYPGAPAGAREGEAS